MRPITFWIAILGAVGLFGLVATDVLTLRAALPGFGAVGAALFALAVTQARREAAEQVLPPALERRWSPPDPVWVAEPPLYRLAALEGAGRPVTERPDASPLAHVEGGIAFADVVLRADAHGTLLDDVDLVVPPRTRVGISGLTRAHKHAIAALLLRLVDPDSGQVLIDGVDVREVRLADLRRHVALALPDALPRSATVREAIAVGRPDATMDELVRAAEAVRADRVIAGLANGYDTPIDEAGAALTPGQWYLLALARAFIQDASIVVLEQPPRGIESPRETFDAIEMVAEARTCLVLADRPLILGNVDAIFELEGGRIRDPGDEPTGGDKEFDATLERMLAHIERRRQSGVGKR